MPALVSSGARNFLSIYPAAVTLTGVTAGDILIFAVEIKSGGSATTGTPATTSGSTSAWTALGSPITNGGSSNYAWLQWFYATATASGSVTVSFSPSNTGVNALAGAFMGDLSGAGTPVMGATDSSSSGSLVGYGAMTVSQSGSFAIVGSVVGGVSFEDTNNAGLGTFLTGPTYDGLQTAGLTYGNASSDIPAQGDAWSLDSGSNWVTAGIVVPPGTRAGPYAPTIVQSAAWMSSIY